jgi:hypothetical protein
MERASSFPCSKPAFNSMTSNANSNAANPPGSRYFTVRFAKAIGRLLKRLLRFTFSRRMVWTLAILASLLMLLHQYENWRAARELGEARAAVLARIGTENLMDILPEVVLEDQNFFAIPIIQSWRKSSATRSNVCEYVFPAEQLLPEGFQSPLILLDSGDLHLDLAGWVRQRMSAGQPIPAGQTPELALKSELGDRGRNIIMDLIAGLHRPESQIIPCRRACLLEADGNPNEARLPIATAAIQLQKYLAIHYLAAAGAGDGAKTRGLTGVMLMLAEGFVSDPNLMSLLLGMELSREVLGALNEGLGCGTLTDADFRQIQKWLARINDVQVTERTAFETLLASATVLDRFKTEVRNHASFGPDFDFRYFSGTLIAPIGWVDANRAFASEMMLLQSGNGGAETWRSGAANHEIVWAELESGIKINPRRLVARIATPALSGTGMWVGSAKNLFKRRCAILTCALHRHRLLHGSYPASLTVLDASLLPSPQPDPARAEAPMNYRLTDKGFLLWSVGMDRVDDGGDAEKDWVWRHEPVKAVIK